MLPIEIQRADFRAGKDQKEWWNETSLTENGMVQKKAIQV
jgi:hypothetical protein